METFRFQPGETPVLVSIPHGGTAVPAEMVGALTDEALALPDTEWDVDRLFHFAPALGVGFLKAAVSRYVVDLDRDPDDVDGLDVCPLETFDHHRVYRTGMEPPAGEKARRLDLYWQPYHDRLTAALAEVRARFGIAVLLDLHSVRSDDPAFDGVPPAKVSLGAAGGLAAAANLVDHVASAAEVAWPGEVEIEGALDGGVAVRRHGQPQAGIHALSIEICQRLYMDEGVGRCFRDDLVQTARAGLERMVAAAVDWAGRHADRRHG